MRSEDGTMAMAWRAGPGVNWSCSHPGCEENGFLWGAIPYPPRLLAVTAGQAYFLMQKWPLSARVFCCSGQLPPLHKLTLYLPGFCQDCFPFHSVMCLKLLGFDCHIFSRTSLMHSCSYTSPCVRLSKHVGRGHTMSNSMEEMHPLIRNPVTKWSLFPHGVRPHGQVPQHLIRCHLKKSLQCKEPFLPIKCFCLVEFLWRTKGEVVLQLSPLRGC